MGDIVTSMGSEAWMHAFSPGATVGRKRGYTSVQFNRLVARMLLLLSPAKSLDYESPLPDAWTQGVHDKTLNARTPEFAREASDLIAVLRDYSPQQISDLMSLSDKLAALNVARYASWKPRHTVKNSRPAMFAFDGDVYDGLQARQLSVAQWEWAQAHVRILSGLYGVLKPMDALQPYRLEMGTRLPNSVGKDLYAFWGDRVSQRLKAELVKLSGKRRVVINCASEEYFKVVKPRLLGAPVITPVFEDWKGGTYKIISFNAKRARGLMARFAITHRIADPIKLQAFDAQGYVFDAAASEEFIWRFRRREGGAA